MPTATEIINKMLEKDAFSRQLNMRRLEEQPGFCRVQLTVTENLCNGFGVAHGGIAYSLADSAVAFSVNSLGEVAVSVESSVTHLLPVQVGDSLICIPSQERVSSRIAVYTAEIFNQKEEKVALFRGVYFRTGKNW